MHGFAIALNIGGLVAALAITFGIGMLLAVAFHGRTLLAIATIVIAAGAVFALPVWSMAIAWSWVPGSGVAVWIVPAVYLAITVPLVMVLFGAASAGARP